MIVLECQRCKSRIGITPEGSVPVCCNKYMKIIGLVKDKSMQLKPGQIDTRDWLKGLTSKDLVPVEGQDIIDKRIGVVRDLLGHFVDITSFIVPGKVGKDQMIVNKKKFELFLDKIARASAKGGLQ